MIPFSVLDLAPITEGSDASTAFTNALDVARHAERLGFNRYWMAEHHSMPGIASSATAVALGYVAGGTSTIRIGAGGIMLPNHAPLVIAEQFGTLESLYPGRIDLGLGRAPGTDRARIRAPPNLASDENQFPRDVMELMNYFSRRSRSRSAHSRRGTRHPIWILGSSTFGAQLAAMLGLPYAFARISRPAAARGGAPCSIAPASSLAAAGAALVHARLQRLRRRHGRGRRISLHLDAAGVRHCAAAVPPAPAPVKGYRETLGYAERAMIDGAMSCSAIGSPEKVAAEIEAFVSALARTS
jgi:luciferase family oxidoreductase group 1